MTLTLRAILYDDMPMSVLSHPSSALIHMKVARAEIEQAHMWCKRAYVTMDDDGQTKLCSMGAIISSFTTDGLKPGSNFAAAFMDPLIREMRTALWKAIRDTDPQWQEHVGESAETPSQLIMAWNDNEHVTHDMVLRAFDQAITDLTTTA